MSCSNRRRSTSPGACIGSFGVAIIDGRGADKIWSWAPTNLSSSPAYSYAAWVGP